MHVLGSITVTRPLANTSETHPKKNTHQQEKKATNNPGPFRYIHFISLQHENAPQMRGVRASTEQQSNLSAQPIINP